jgi:transcriptional regulator with XRE-family HTH domain
MWIQLESFKSRLKEYQARTGKTQVQVAEDLGTSYGTLRFWLAGVRPPSLSTLQNAANIFGCSVSEFIDDPAKNIAGQNLSDSSEKKRFLAGLIVKDLRMEDLTDDDAEQIYRAAAKERDWILARKARRDGKGT